MNRRQPVVSVAQMIALLVSGIGCTAKESAESVATVAAKVPIGDSIAARPSQSAPAPDAVMDAAKGTWAWAQNDSTCRFAKYDLSFSDDRKYMLLMPIGIRSDTGELKTTRYRITGIGHDVHPNNAYVIRGAIEGESRKDDYGKSVVWDLVMITANRFHWHRADWGLSLMTAPLIRCQDDEPMEDWRASE